MESEQDVEEKGKREMGRSELEGNEKKRRKKLIDMEGSVVVNAVEIQEATGMEGRVRAYKVEGQVNSDWKLLSEGTTIGARKVDRFSADTVWKVKCTILQSEGYPALKKIGLYNKR